MNQANLPECPEDEDEGVNGAKPVAYPLPGANCNRIESLF